MRAVPTAPTARAAARAGLAVVTRADFTDLSDRTYDAHIPVTFH